MDLLQFFGKFQVKFISSYQEGVAGGIQRNGVSHVLKDVFSSFTP